MVLKHSAILPAVLVCSLAHWRRDRDEPAAEYGSSPDSPLERDGFENSVPRQIGSGFKASVGLGPIDVGAAESSGRSSGSATDRAVSAAQEAAPTAEMKTPTLLAVARHRGTDSISLQRRV